MSPITIRLRELRERAGLTQEALADRAGVSVTSISNIERRAGAQANINTRVIEALASALGVRPLELLGETDRPKRRPRRT